MKIVAFMFIAILCGCTKEPLKTGRTNNPNFEVGLLFDYGGCKVYRFLDEGRFHYFTNCGETMSPQSCGKSCILEEHVGKFK